MLYLEKKSETNWRVSLKTSRPCESISGCSRHTDTFWVVSAETSSNWGKTNSLRPTCLRYFKRNLVNFGSWQRHCKKLLCGASSGGQCDLNQHSRTDIIAWVLIVEKWFNLVLILNCRQWNDTPFNVVVAVPVLPVMVWENPWNWNIHVWCTHIHTIVHVVNEYKIRNKDNFQFCSKLRLLTNYKKYRITLCNACTNTKSTISKMSHLGNQKQTKHFNMNSWINSHPEWLLP